VKKCIPGSETPLQKLIEAPSAKHAHDVRKSAGKEDIATRKRKTWSSVRRMVYSQSTEFAKPHSFCFSYQLPSPTHAAITPPASQVSQPLQQDQEAYEKETRRSESEKSKIR
jgi:hypothetical protein